MLERAHGTPCCPRGGGLTHLPSKAFDFIQAEKPLGSSVLPQLLPKSLQACGTRGKEMHFNPSSAYLPTVQISLSGHCLPGCENWARRDSSLCSPSAWWSEQDSGNETETGTAAPLCRWTCMAKEKPERNHDVVHSVF